MRTAARSTTATSSTSRTSSMSRSSLSVTLVTKYPERGLIVTSPS